MSWKAKIKIHCFPMNVLSFSPFSKYGLLFYKVIYCGHIFICTDISLYCLHCRSKCSHTADNHQINNENEDHAIPSSPEELNFKQHQDWAYKTSK